VRAVNVRGGMANDDLEARRRFPLVRKIQGCWFRVAMQGRIFNACDLGKFQAKNLAAISNLPRRRVTRFTVAVDVSPRLTSPRLTIGPGASHPAPSHGRAIGVEPELA
jgi:hypothetical protein